MIKIVNSSIFMSITNFLSGPFLFGDIMILVKAQNTFRDPHQKYAKGSLAVQKACTSVSSSQVHCHHMAQRLTSPSPRSPLSHLFHHCSMNQTFKATFDIRWRKRKKPPFSAATLCPSPVQ